MRLGHDEKLYILAFDHRGSFEKMFGIKGRAPTAEEVARIQDAKRLIFEGFQLAIEAGAPKSAAGVLVDGQYGPEVAREAKAAGFNLAMPVEKSGQEEFDFEYGDAFGENIADYGPTFSKVLVRYNTQGDHGMNERQSARLKRLSDWLHDNDRKFLFELLVPATEAQLVTVGGDAERFDTEVRPGLMMDAIREIQAVGIEPDIWKIEGLDSRDHCQEIAELVRRDGRDAVSCVVLGRGASHAKVNEWLRAGSGVPGYVGFAIGRSIFGESVKALAAGEGERAVHAQAIADLYRGFIDVYESASN
jgi:myo-inositol catabolism protein IolC